MVNNKLTPMQEKFKNFRLEGKTQAESYKLAGYTVKDTKSLDSMASRLSSSARVCKAIEKGRGELAKKHEIKSEEIIQELKGIGLSNLTDVMSWDEEGNTRYKASEDLPESVRAGIKKFKKKSRTHYDKDGKPKYTDNDIEIEMHNKVPALEKLGVYKGLWKDEKGDTFVLNQFLQAIQNKIGMVELK